MTQPELFAAALGLSSPWIVKNIVFSAEEKRLDIYIDFVRGGMFSCPVCKKLRKAYDTSEDSWRHLNFFQYAAYLHARVPRVDCDGCGVTRKLEVPWARSGAGFTLLFEALIMSLVKEMPVKTVGDLIGEHDTLIWRIIHHYVDQAVEQRDLSAMTTVGVDETASRRGHKYVSFFFDLDDKRLAFGTSGKDSTTVERFAKCLKEHGGEPTQVTKIACDMSPAFIKGIKANLPQAAITFDRFHLTKVVNDAVDQVRREEVVENEELKKTRYLWLSNPKNLTVAQRRRLDSLSCQNLKTVRAYHIRLTFQDFFSKPDKLTGEAFLATWYFWATHSRLKPIIEAAKTIKAHWDGVISWFDSRISTGLLEGFNSLLQAAKARARGYRSDRNMIAMAYLIAGKLDLDLPT
jgi:transposase